MKSKKVSIIDFILQLAREEEDIGNASISVSLKFNVTIRYFLRIINLLIEQKKYIFINIPTQIMILLIYLILI